MRDREQVLRVDVASYRAGRTEGLQSYCRLGNALNEGLAGNSYGGVCPAPVDQNFRILHEAGYRTHEAHSTLARLQREQNQLQYELRDSKTAEDRKRTLRDLLSRSDRRIEDARDALRSAEFRLDYLRNDLRQRSQY